MLTTIMEVIGMNTVEFSFDPDVAGQVTEPGEQAGGESDQGAGDQEGGPQQHEDGPGFHEGQSTTVGLRGAAEVRPASWRWI